MNKLFFAIAFLALTASAQAQKLPFANIEEYPADYTPGNILTRMIDGLAFRYYWATDGLTNTDLEYQIAGGGRDMLKTLQHLHGLSVMIMKTATDQPNTGNNQSETYSFRELRKITLQNLEVARKAFAGKTDRELSQMAIVFTYGENSSQVPLWHLINGPIADAIYHTGQVVVFRRANGNPMDPKVNVFMGTRPD